MTSLLSLTGKLWKLHRPEHHNHSIVDLLRRERGISDDPAAKLFDPFLFPEMQRAVDRIEQAMQEREIIAIFGDYDADGITATAQLVRFFERHGITPVVHLPDRVKEGYGMRKESIDLLHKRGVSLVITVDTGISAHAEIVHAKTLGIDVIVTDHHRPSLHGKAPDGSPDALAVIHPLVPTPVPNPNLCGAGVAFMVVRALERGSPDTSLKSDVPWQDIEIDIALAAIGTIGDLVPLVGENRLLVQHGLRCLENLPPSPLKDLVDSVRGNAPMTATDVAFKIVPRLNAAGRMSHPMIALDAILKGGASLAELHLLNSNRQIFVDDLHRTIEPLVDPSHPFIVLAHGDITPGTAGLLASRFTERFTRPSLVAALLGGKAVASIRSIPEIDVMEYLTHTSVSKHLQSFGGHRQAAGCTFDPTNLGALQQALNTLLREQGFSPEMMKPTLEIDAALQPECISLSLAKTLASLAPFGQSNEEPILLLSGQRITDVRPVGADGSHLQCRIGGVKAIGFRLGSLLEHLGEDNVFDVAVRVGVNVWNGKESVQLFVEDIRSNVS